MQITFVKGSRAADRRVYCAYLESDVRRIQTWANIPFYGDPTAKVINTRIIINQANTKTSPAPL